jgi:chaperone modulatory protein CbpM
MKNQNRHSLNEAASQIGLAPDVIIRFVSFQWIIPADWQHHVLDEEDMARARLIWELQHEFEVNDEAVPIILNLIDQLNRLQLELKDRYESTRR